MKELDKSKLILLPPGNTLKWDEDAQEWVDAKDAFGLTFKESDLRFILGETIQQVEPRWYDGLDIARWAVDGLTIKRDGWHLFQDGSASDPDATPYKFPTPAKAIEVINALIEAEQ